MCVQRRVSVHPCRQAHLIMAMGLLPTSTTSAATSIPPMMPKIMGLQQCESNAALASSPSEPDGTRTCRCKTTNDAEAPRRHADYRKEHSEDAKIPAFHSHERTTVNDHAQRGCNIAGKLSFWSKPTRRRHSAASMHVRSHMH